MRPLSFEGAKRKRNHCLVEFGEVFSISIDYLIFLSFLLCVLKYDCAYFLKVFFI
jgi:hypothetical protein